MSAGPTLPDYIIRPAAPADLDRLVALLLELQDHVEESNPDTWRMTAAGRAEQRQQIASRLGAERTCALVAEHPEVGVVGCLFARIIVNNRYDPPRAGFFDQLAVRADHRRAGVATRLVAAACRFFAEQGVDDLSLRCIAGNAEAAAFWAALGFTPRIITAGSPRARVEAKTQDLRGLGGLGGLRRFPHD